MKFLLFNITVLTALAYLFFDNGQMQKISNDVQHSTMNVIEKVKTLGKPLELRLNESNQSKTDFKPASLSHDENKRLPAKQSYNLKNGSEKSKPLNSKPKTTKEVLPLPEPEFIATRAEPNIQKPGREDDKTTNQRKDISSFKKEEDHGFMSRSDRRKELQKLAQSAEDLFINRMTK
ncbi:MAG: hypothetical protein MKZ89_13435 [Nisaea sp.]|nr:hypothetical protein [Nisaea sp.]